MDTGLSIYNIYSLLLYEFFSVVIISFPATRMYLLFKINGRDKFRCGGRQRRGVKIQDLSVIPLVTVAYVRNKCSCVKCAVVNPG